VICTSFATSHCSFSCISHEVLAVIPCVMIYATVAASITKAFAELFVQQLHFEGTALITLKVTKESLST